MTAPAVEEVRLGRSAASMSALTALSRATGFVRVLVVTAVLGRGALGDTYETANTVPNILFELFAAGALQAVLVPGLVGVLDREGRDGAERVAGAVLGALLGILGALVAVAMVAAPVIMRALNAAGPDRALAAAKAELGTLFLWFFLPQVLCYGVGAVATGVLNAEHRFLAPVAAPMCNNVVVLAAYALFQGLRGGAAPGLDLTGLEKGVLAVGTTLGVVAFTALPVIALARTGFRLRPRLSWDHPAVRRLAHDGAWAGAYLTFTQALLAAVLVLANATPGAVVTFTFAYTIVLVPYALFAMPVATALYPGLARAHQAGDHGRFTAVLARGTAVTMALVVPCAAAVVALAWPAVRVAAFGAAREGGLAPLAHCLAAFGPGLVGYSILLLATRASYALGDARTPTYVNGGVAAGGVLAMVAAGALASHSERATALAGAYSLAQVVGAVVLTLLVWRRAAAVQERAGAPSAATGLPGPVALSLGAGAAAALMMAVVAALLDGRGHLAAAVTLAVAGGAGLAVYAAVQRLVARRPLRSLVALEVPGG